MAEDFKNQENITQEEDTKNLKMIGSMNNLQKKLITSLNNLKYSKKIKKLQK